MPSPEAVENYLLEYRREGREAFLRNHTNPVLLIKRAEPNDDGWSGFNTETFRVNRKAIVGTWSNEELDAAVKAQGWQALAIAKSPDNPWRGRVSLGRARNNDLVINAPSVSKLHAHFMIEDDASVRLTDAGSHNGTTVNGKRLAADKPQVLADGDQLVFGDVVAIFYSPVSFAAYLGGLFAVDDPPASAPVPTE